MFLKNVNISEIANEIISNRRIKVSAENSICGFVSLAESNANGSICAVRKFPQLVQSSFQLKLKKLSETDAYLMLIQSHSSDPLDFIRRPTT